MTDTAGPTPRHAVQPRDAFVAELDRLRRRAARGTGRARVSLEQLADATGVPRSTVHAYVSGQRLPPADVLDRVVVALGATPAEQSQWAELLERLAAGTAGGATITGTGPAEKGTPHRTVPDAPRLLPAAPAGFVGRVEELARLDALLARHVAQDSAGTPMVVGLTGLGGVGKTAVALRWAHANAARFPEGQLWVDLRGYSAAPPLDPADALERLLRAVGVGTAELPPDVDARADMFRSAVAGSRMLLVLDNARNAAQVLPLLPGADGSLTLVTSRDSLRALGVNVGAARVPVGRMSHADSVLLMTEELPADTAAEVVSSGVVAACEGLPLAMRILRERLSPAGPADVHRLAEHLGRDRRALLESLDLNDESVDVSVRGAFDLSYEALTPDAARLFRRLPLCLLSTIDVDAALAVVGDDPVTGRRAVEQLVAAHLLDPAGPGTVRLHDMVADYARERLDRDETADTTRAARLALCEYLLDRCESMVALRVPPVPFRLTRPARSSGAPVATFAGLPQAASWVEQNVDLLIAAVADAAVTLGPDAPGHVYALAERVWRVLHALGSVTGLLDAMRAVEDVAERHGHVDVAVVTARLHGVGSGRAMQLDDAEHSFRRAIAHSERLEPNGYSWMDVVNLAMTWAVRGDLTRAIDVLTSDPWGHDWNDDVGENTPDLFRLFVLAELQLQAGDAAAAAATLAQLSAMQRDLGRWDAERLEFLVYLDIANGDWTSARAQMPTFEAAARTGVDSGLIVEALTARARIDAYFGDVESAEANAIEAVQSARRFGVRGREMSAKSALAEILVLTDRAQRAVDVLTPVVEETRRLGLRYSQCQSMAGLARALTAVGRVGEASGVNAEAASIAHECGFGLLAREIAGDLPDTMSRAFLFF